MKRAATIEEADKKFNLKDEVTIVFVNLKPEEFEMLVMTLIGSSMLFLAERQTDKLNRVVIRDIEYFRARTFPFHNRMLNVYAD